jgi:hypothetical protein
MNFVFEAKRAIRVGVLLMLPTTAEMILNPKEAADNPHPPPEVPSVPTVGGPAPIITTVTGTIPILTHNGGTVRLIRGR